MAVARHVAPSARIGHWPSSKYDIWTMRPGAPRVKVRIQLHRLDGRLQGTGVGTRAGSRSRDHPTVIEPPIAHPGSDGRFDSCRDEESSSPLDSPPHLAARGPIVNIALRIVLLIWVVGYLFASCAPILNGHLILGTLAVFGGIVFFVPWLVGIFALWFLIQATNRPR